MATTLYASFDDVENAERAAGALLDYGAKPEDLSLVRRHDADEPPAVYTAGTSRAIDNQYDNLAETEGEKNYDPEEAAKAGLTATTPQDAGSGAVKGAEIGLGVGALAALASIFVPGFGLVVGGGALATALAGLVGTTGAGAIAGAMTGYLKDQGMDAHLAERYATTVSEGGALVAIRVPSEKVDESTARSIFNKYGAAHTSEAIAQTGGYMA